MGFLHLGHSLVNGVWRTSKAFAAAIHVAAYAPRVVDMADGAATDVDRSIAVVFARLY